MSQIFYLSQVSQSVADSGIHLVGRGTGGLNLHMPVSYAVPHVCMNYRGSDILRGLSPLASSLGSATDDDACICGQVCAYIGLAQALVSAAKVIQFTAQKCCGIPV